MTPELQNLWDLLSREHRGRARAVTAASLARHFSTEVRVIMRLKELLVKEYGKPIAATKKTPKGLFVAQTQEEKDEYQGVLKSTILETWALFQAFKTAPLEVVEQSVFAFPNPELIGAERR